MDRVRLRRLIIAGVVLGAALTLFLFNPESSSFFPPCLFKKITGFDCPGCGSTRGMHALLHGHVLQAIDFNLLLLPGLFFIALSAVYQWHPRLQRLWAKMNQPRLTLWIVCAFWILRNVPYAPLRWLNSGF